MEYKAVSESSVFKDGRPPPVVDLDLDEEVVLKRYDMMLRTFIMKGQFTLLKREFTTEDIGRNMQSTLLDYSVSYAFQGSDYIDEILTNMQYTVLQAALILTITMSFYMSPPDIKSDHNKRLFSAFIGVSACTHIFVLILITILTALFYSPYCYAEAMYLRVKCKSQFILSTVLNYVANIFAIMAMLVSGFDRYVVDGAVQLYFVGILAALVTYLIQNGKLGARNQDERVFMFYKKYCDPNGELKDEYLEKIYK
jgi:hypothetical protein